MNTPIILPPDLAHKLIADQFSEYARLSVPMLKNKGMITAPIGLASKCSRMPTAADYASKVRKEQELLPQLAKRLSVNIPAPIKMGKPSAYTEETSAVARKMSGELAKPILIGEHKRNPKSDNANVDSIKDRLSAVIDFGGVAVGDPACDLVIAWTYLSGKACEIFISKMDLDPDTWLRGRAWALWKATFELCQISDKNSSEAEVQKRIIDEVA